MSLPSESTSAPPVVRAVPAILLRVLFVEDNVVNPKLAVHVLKKHGCDEQVANNRRIAVEICQQSDFDAIFMNVQVSVINGLEALQLICQREAQTRRHTPIIAMTARDEWSWRGMFGRRNGQL